jgi:tetratricopeptide (TPR) repeat protein
MRAKELLRSYQTSTKSDQKQAAELLLKRLIPDMERNSQKQEFRTMRMLHIVLANTYDAFGDLKSATGVLERFLKNLDKSSRGIPSEDAVDALYNLACYHSERAEKITDTTAKREMLRKAATYLKTCLEVAKAVGDDFLEAEIAMAKKDTHTDLKALGEAKEILREFGIAHLWDGQKNG